MAKTQTISVGPVGVDPVSGITWVMVPAGSVRTQRGVVLTVKKPFLMAQTPVTQDQYSRVMGSNPARFKGDGRRPVENSTADEADEFSRRVGGRLPTEEEWEYAALGGQSKDPYGPVREIAWYGKNSKRSTQPVGLKKPNSFGLYDMLGNVMHWTSSLAYGERVFRGGCWDLGSAGWVRAAVRSWFGPGFRSINLGFRPVRDIPQTRFDLIEPVTAEDPMREFAREPEISKRIRMIELDGLRSRRRR